MSFAKFFQDAFNSFNSQIQLGLPAKIDKFDKSTMLADVKFFLQNKDAQGTLTDYPIVHNIPVQFIFANGFYIRPEYHRGDKVWVTFSTFDIEKAMDEQTGAEGAGIFGMQNASVTGSIATNQFTAPDAFGNEDGLIMGHEDGNCTVVFASDNIKFKFGSGAEEITFSASGIETKQMIKAGLEVVANNSAVPVHLSTHMHPTAAPGAPSPPTPGS
jgi:hypothetical protein